MYIDTHTHIYLGNFDEDRDEVVKRALDKGVKKLLLPNIDSTTVDSMMNLVDEYPQYCFPMMGLHPSSVGEEFERNLLSLKKILIKGSFLAIGEIGIDLYWDKTFRNQQEVAFREQLNWGKEFHLPVVIHSRDSFNEIFSIMDQEISNGCTGVFHSFTGGKQELEKIREYDFYFGINGIVSFKNSNLADVVADIPLDRLLLETDSPYLAPVPRRGKRNESSFLPYTAAKLAEIFNLPVKEIARITTDNANRLFKLNE